MNIFTLLIIFAAILTVLFIVSKLIPSQDNTVEDEDDDQYEE